MEAVAASLGTVFVSALVALAVFFAVRSLWKGKKSGKGCAGCSCSCGGSCGCRRGRGQNSRV